MQALFGRILKLGSSCLVGIALSTSLVGCESLKLGKELGPGLLWDCGWTCVQGGWRAAQEIPTVEASLERVNTAARLVELGELMLQGLPLSPGSLWPREMVGALKLTWDAQVMTQIAKGLSVPKSSYGGGAAYQPSVWTGRALEMQKRLFTSPPDLYYERTYRSKVPSEQDVHGLRDKVLGPQSNQAFDPVFYRLLRFHPGFIPKQELFSARFDGKAAEFFPNVMEAVYFLADNRDDLLKIREDVLQTEEAQEKAYRDVEESMQRIRELKAQEFGKPATPEEAAEKGEEISSPKNLKELEAQVEVEQKQYEAAVTAYKASLQQLSLAMEQIRSQATGFTPEQKALATNVQTVVDITHTLVGGTKFLVIVAGYHLSKAVPNMGKELQMIAMTGGDQATKRIQRIVTNVSLLPTNLKIILTETGVLSAESDIYDGLFANRMDAPTVAAK